MKTSSSCVKSNTARLRLEQCILVMNGGAEADAGEEEEKAKRLVKLLFP
jgi:hypothetical protein